MLFLLGDNGRISYRMPTYYAAVLLTHEWTKPGGGIHELYKATTNDPLLTAYAVLRPDGLWAVLLINKDSDNTHEVKIEFESKDLPCKGLAIGYAHGEVDVYQYSGNQYQLGADFRPTKDWPPEHQRLKFGGTTTFKLPPYSLTVVRG